MENFAKIHENQRKSPLSSLTSSSRHRTNHEFNNFKSLPCETLPEHPKEGVNVPLDHVIENSPSNKSTYSHTIDLDRHLSITKTKDIDQQSVASSTHFTIVNGFGTPKRFQDTSVCRRSRQITILIVTMTVLFMIAICVTVFLMESEY